MKNYFFALLFAVAFTAAAQAETLSFVSAWKKINSASAAQDASRLQTQALRESQSRASRHWLPRVYLDAKSYQTNAPGASFFGLLEQRALVQSDFNPDSINRPDSQLFTRAALGLDLPLYEGGMKASQAQMLKHATLAGENQTRQVQLEQYSIVGLSYGSLAVLAQQKNRLVSLHAEIERMIQGYQLGIKSNPVGYSGLLGMKSLSNRLTGLIQQYEAQSQAYFAALSEMGLQDLNWTPEAMDSNTFVNFYLSPTVSQTQGPTAFKVAAAQETAKSADELAKMERAKFLPRVGAFAETAAFHGNRDTANSYNAGVYLQWNLFNPADYGSVREARLKSQALFKSTQALTEQERSEKSALQITIKSLRQNINLLNDSYKLLIEQAKMTQTLFRNGSINALQMVEIMNRRADLITQQSDAELSLIKTSAQVVTKEAFDIEAHLNKGAKNENQ
ncbi:MAG: TolC family protein [Bdellovibrionales bacterium]